MQFIRRWIEKDRDDVDRLRRGEVDGPNGPDLQRNLSRWFLAAMSPFALLLISDGLGWQRGFIANVVFVSAFAWFLAVVGLMTFSFWKAHEPPSD